MAHAQTTLLRSNSIAAGFADVAHDLAERFARRRIYRRTLRELSQLSVRELDDLGLTPSNVRTTAWDAAYGPRSHS